MVHKVLPARAALLPQPRPKQQGWAGPSRLASASFSADIVSRSSASSGACASLLLPPGERNPKSIKVRLSASTSRALAPWMLYLAESQAVSAGLAPSFYRGVAAVSLRMPRCHDQKRSCPQLTPTPSVLWCSAAALLQHVMLCLLAARASRAFVAPKVHLEPMSCSARSSLAARSSRLG